MLVCGYDCVNPEAFQTDTGILSSTLLTAVLDQVISLAEESKYYSIVLSYWTIDLLLD